LWYRDGLQAPDDELIVLAELGEEILNTRALLREHAARERLLQDVTVVTGTKHA
jgi:hypothetical protein